MVRFFLLSLLLIVSMDVCVGFVRTGSRFFKLATSLKELNVDDFEGAQFTEIQTVNDVISKFKLAASVPISQMDSYLAEYKGELKKRGIKFPGFRVGIIPPQQMVAIRRYIFGFALENVIGNLANVNSLRLCNEDGSDVELGSDKYFEEIVQLDANGLDYTKQRDGWREGTEVNFVAEFFAEVEKGEGEEENSESDEGRMSRANVIDVEGTEILDTPAQ